ncbi:MAG TPA: KGG domain-containing protein [Ramlibacter sp.]|nr:KGG domain-containing protein [Ramlibacter sp.]
MQDTSTTVTTESSSATPQTSRLRGFAAMSPEKKKEIASMGGRAAHACGRAHQFSSEEARAAGKKRHQRKDGPTA